MNLTMFTDDQMRGFIRDGYVVVDTALSSRHHQEIWDRIDNVFETEGNPGNNLIARVPAIQKVFDDPKVNGALTGILGPGYYMHPHRHCHYRPPRSEGQMIHKDSFTKRRHRTRWVLALYYPQDTSVDMGPTAVMPGSHYYNWFRGPKGLRSRIEGTEGEVPLQVGAGTVVLVHYDIWHRGMANTSDNKRYMVKVMFTRIEEPTAPSWTNSDEHWDGGVSNPLRGACQAMWDWHRGSQNRGNGVGARGFAEIMGLATRLRGDDESTCLNATYSLAELGDAAVPALVDAMKDEPDVVRLNASYALSTIGTPAVEALCDLAKAVDVDTRASAVETLADIGPGAVESTSILIDALRDESVLVRRHAAEALGTVTQRDSSAAGPLAQMFGDENVEVRRNAALALARIGPHADESTGALADALEDNDRYVRGKAAHALRRIGTDTAMDSLLRFLETSRWCYSTTQDSLY